MGNTQHVHLKEQFLRQQMTAAETAGDSLLGPFTAVRLPGPPPTTALVKTLDPRIYDEYTDIGEAVRKLKQDHPCVSAFLFVCENQRNPELYNLAFEYGEPLNTFVHEEPTIWSYLDQIVEAVIFLEGQGYHYPVLSKQFVLNTGRGAVKLLNPYAFTDFMKEILQIYLNPQNPMSSRRSYFMGQIGRNIRELGVLVATLVSNCSDVQLKTDPNYVVKVTEAIGAKFSKNLVAVIRTLLQNNGQLKSFSDVRVMLQKLRASGSEPGGFGQSSTGYPGSFRSDQGPSTPMNKQMGQQGFASTSPVLNQPQGPQQPGPQKQEPGSAVRQPVQSLRDTQLGQPLYGEDRKLKIFDDQTGNQRQYPNRPVQEVPASSAQMFQNDPNLAKKYQTNPNAGFPGQSQSLYESTPPMAQPLPSQITSLPTIPVPAQPILRSPSPQKLPVEGPVGANPGSYKPGPSPAPSPAPTTVQSAPPQVLPQKPPSQEPQRQGAPPGLPPGQPPAAPGPISRVQSTPSNPLLFSVTGNYVPNRPADPAPSSTFPGQPAMTPASPLLMTPPRLEAPQSVPQEDSPATPEAEQIPTEEEQLFFQKRTSLNSEPIIHSNDKPDFLFVNAADPHNVNVTSYLQRRESGINGNILDGVISFNKSDFFDTDTDHTAGHFRNNLNPASSIPELKPDFLSASQTELPPAPPARMVTPSVVQPRQSEELRDVQGGPQGQSQGSLNASAPPLQPVQGHGGNQGQPMQPFATQPVPPAPQTPAVQQVQPIERQKLITKINIRWLPDEKRHQKVVEYEDKSTEEVPFTEEEKLKFITGPSPAPQPQPPQPPSPVSPSPPSSLGQVSPGPQSPYPQVPPSPKAQPYQPPTQPQPRPVQTYSPQPPSPQTIPPLQPFQQTTSTGSDILPKASNMHHYNIPNEGPSDNTLLSASGIPNCATLSICPQGSENTILLFRSRPLNPNSRFGEFGSLVNRRDPLAPSMYHNVEQPHLNTSSLFGKKEASLGDLNHIRREEYHKPVSMDNLPRVASKPSTVLASNARVIKKI